MALRSQKQILVGLDRMAGLALGRALLGRMDTGPLQRAIEAIYATAARRFGKKTALAGDLFERLSEGARQQAFRIAQVILEQRKAMLPPQGRTTAPTAGTTTAASGEEELIANALKEHKGNHKDAMIALQIKLKEPLIAEGLTHKAANAQCAARYPGIFGAAA